jgi:SAM-dependent methyltransferase
VLDIGCGSAQWLVRLLKRLPRAQGVGVDLSTEVVQAARALAAASGVNKRIDIRQSDASGIGDERYDALLCIGSTHALGGLTPTLQSMHRWAAPRAIAVIGDGFWQRPPDDAALGALDATVAEFPSYAGLVDIVESSGWAPMHIHVSDLHEWDDYEWSWVSNLRRWAQQNPNDPDAADAAALAQEHLDQWLKGYRETLGFAVVIAERTVG